MWWVVLVSVPGTAAVIGVIALVVFLLKRAKGQGLKNSRTATNTAMRNAQGAKNLPFLSFRTYRKIVSESPSVRTTIPFGPLKVGLSDYHVWPCVALCGLVM